MKKQAQFTNTTTTDAEHLTFEGDTFIQSLLSVSAPEGAVAVDRCQIPPLFVVGRDVGAHMRVNDSRVSKRHFRISESDNGFEIADLESRNGTFVNGQRIFGRRLLVHNDIIRAGNLLFVFYQDKGEVLQPLPLDRYNMAGDFHLGPIVHDIRAAAISRLNILITGPSGAGKELVARGLYHATYSSTPGAPLIVHNAAQFSSEEEAATTLFGVGAKVFSDVSAKPGLIEQADGGMLFLDEVHNLPERVQRTLLRVIEDGAYSRIGENKTRRIQVRFILASNALPPTYGLAHDLLARLRVVKLPSLAARVADIPSIFEVMLERSAGKLNQDFNNIKAALKSDHYEVLCLDGFKNDNVRGLIRVADEICTYVATGMTPAQAISKVFVDSFANNPVLLRSRDGSTTRSHSSGNAATDAVSLPDSNEWYDNDAISASSHYERNKSAIITAFNESAQNVSRTLRRLNQSGIRCSRRWLDIYLDKWGVERRRYKARG